MIILKTIIYKITENQKLLNILDIDRVNDRTKWIKLGYLLFSIYDYDEGLIIFIKKLDIFPRLILCISGLSWLVWFGKRNHLFE